jgi:hypothetical protein
MEVLKPGVPAITEYYVGRCKSCEAIVKVHRAELYLPRTLPIKHRCPACESIAPTIDFYPYGTAETHGLLLEVIQHLQDPKP